MILTLQSRDGLMLVLVLVSVIPVMIGCIDISNFSYHSRYQAIDYRIVGKFGEFDESSMIPQTKTIQISIYNQ